MQIYDRIEDESDQKYAYRTLRRNIMTLQMLPGILISEIDIAEELKIDQESVHEVVERLREDLLIRIYSKNVIMVSKIDISVFKEGYFLRSIVEPKLVELLAGNVNTKGMKQLNENLRMQKEVIEEDEFAVDEFFRLDDAFHHIIYDLAGKPNVWDAVRRVCTHYDRIRYLDIIENQIDLSVTYEEHKMIAGYLLTGVLQQADIREFYETHLGTYLRNFLQLIEEYPDYFGK